MQNDIQESLITETSLIKLQPNEPTEQQINSKYAFESPKSPSSSNGTTSPSFSLTSNSFANKNGDNSFVQCSVCGDRATGIISNRVYK